MGPMANPPKSNRLNYGFALLTVLMVSHLSFLAIEHSKAEEFMDAAETYVTVILALMAPTPLMK